METKHQSSEGVNEGVAYGLRVNGQLFFSSFKPIRRGVEAFVMRLVLP